MAGKSHETLKRVGTALTVWALTKVLDNQKVHAAMSDVDKRLTTKIRKAERKTIRRAQNVVNNRMWLAAGVAAFAAGVGFMAQATKPRKW
jgi:ElaB/YqjD/DUF883 family membrane-anchored ribosome-binding protein